MACREIMCDGCMKIQSLRGQFEKMRVKIPFASDARRAAKQLGWTCFESIHEGKKIYKDYCPECAKSRGVRQGSDGNNG